MPFYVISQLDLAKIKNYLKFKVHKMKKIILSILAVVFPFVVFLIMDLPGAAFVALGLQSTIFGWPIAIIWAFKHVIKTCDDDKLKNAAAIAAAAAKAATEAQAKIHAEAQAKAKEEQKS